MDTSHEERKIFSEIQKKLFYMIPEKWEGIYLYASIVEESFKKPRGEMFFYYFPKGILKKNPVNVYEIPGLFNIDEETYNDLINKLFIDIKNLRRISREKHPVLWTNITITIEGFQFKIEYNYDDLGKNSEFNPYERHVIWRYEHLGLEFESLSRQEKEIITRYLNSELSDKENRNVYTEGLYKQNVHNIIDYAKTISLETALALQEGKENKDSSFKEKLESLRKKNKELKEAVSEINQTSNQILVGVKEDNESDDIEFENEVLTSEKMMYSTDNSDFEDEVDDEIDWDDELLTTEKMIQKKRNGFNRTKRKALTFIFSLAFCKIGTQTKTRHGSKIKCFNSLIMSLLFII